MFIARAVYSKFINFSLEENADNYIQAGWELIETRTILIGDDAAILVYGLGWPRNAGNPVEPQVIEEAQAFQYLRPSLN
ncbi:MAG: hypothetical protein ACXW4U_06465 [Anaerolineales bacterium]